MRTRLAAPPAAHVASRGVIVLYPVLLVVAAVLVATGDRQGGRGWRWFAAWCAAGAAFTFSFLTGLSIGLLVLPFAAVALIAVAVRSPHVAESIGLVAGAGLVVLLVGALNWGADQRGADPVPWLVAGLAVTAVSAAGYQLARHLREPSAQTRARDPR